MKRRVFFGLLVLIGFSFFLTTNSYAHWNDLSNIISPNWFEELSSCRVEIIVKLEDEAKEETFKAWLNHRNITHKFEQIQNGNGMRALVGPEDGLRIEVSGERWCGPKINILKTKVRGPKWQRDIDFRAFWVKVDAMETIGPEGGVIEVSDPDSPIYGAKIEIPEGTFPDGATMTISIQNNPPSNALPNGIIQEGPCISFESTNPDFQEPVIIYVPFQGDRQEDEIMMNY